MLKLDTYNKFIESILRMDNAIIDNEEVPKFEEVAYQEFLKEGCKSGKQRE